MIGTTDWTGLATFITALGAVLTGLIASIASLKANAKVSTPPGAPTLGELGTNVAAAVTTPPDSPPLGELLDHVHEVVCNGTTGETPAVAPGEGAGT